MFILRTSTKDSVINNILGEEYRFHRKGSKEFERIFEWYCNQENCKFPNVYGLVGCTLHDGEEKIFLLFDYNWYYVMTSNGQTFEKLYPKE